MAYNYDDGEVTPREQQARWNQQALGEDAASNQTELYKNQLANYDLSDRFNSELADEQRRQLGQKANTERYQQFRKLQQATTGVANAMGNALSGSGDQVLGEMATERKDQDNVDYWQQYVDNLNAVNNSQMESLNQNELNRADLAANQRYALRSIQNDLAANYNNINPEFFVRPGEDGAYFGKPDNSRNEEQWQAPNTDYYQDYRRGLDSGYVQPKKNNQTINR